MLTEARALIGKHQPREAVEKLAALLPTLAKEPYALAVTHQVMGYAYGDQDDYRHAIESFKKALSYQALPDEVTHDLTYNVAHPPPGTPHGLSGSPRVPGGVAAARAGPQAR